MKSLVDLLKKGDGNSYRQAVEMASSLGPSALPLLKEAFGEPDPVIRERVVKMIGAVEDLSVIPFLEKALDDPHFNVRQSAALSLKILTGDDYYSHIYKTEIGRQFKRSFWCYLDFVPEDQQETHKQDNQAIRENFVSFFKSLKGYWTYPDPAQENYFNTSRKKHLILAEDGRVLFKNFNYYLGAVLVPARDFLYLLGSLGRVIKTATTDPAEKEDILGCIRMAISAQLRKLEKGLGGFLATFHHLRTEFSLALPRRESFYLSTISSEPDADDQALMELLSAGLIGYNELRAINNLESDKVARHLVMLRKCIIKFLNLCEGFGSNGHMSLHNYRILKGIGLVAHEAAIHNLILLSYWCKDE